MPEWDDYVDADYDFLHDEHSFVNKSRRDLAYIWDLFEYKTTPIDGVLISREQVEESPAKFERLTSNGVYDDPNLHLPEWLPTISDCGAWGYKQLPFPPYGKQDMLDFYEELNVDVGVTIDHLVLGSGHTSRLYLDQNAFSKDFFPGDLPETLLNAVDVMISDWPRRWPEYVTEYEPSICQNVPIESFRRSDFEGSVQEILDRLTPDPRAVYRDDDTQFRYELTLTNAAEMWNLYHTGEYSFRLMVAIQGSNPDAYVKATNRVLDLGCQYIGIGGVAGSREKIVEEIVSAVGNQIARFQQDNNSRIDAHVFGFAKTGAFETIGRSGMTSFDSASMLRSAWTGGGNYHLSPQERYDALRLRYPQPGDPLAKAIEIDLLGKALHHALRAFDSKEPINEALERWHRNTLAALAALPDYLQQHRFDDRYEADHLRDVEDAFRENYSHSRMLRASFGRQFRRQIVKLLRADEKDDPIPWESYLKLVESAQNVFDQNFSGWRSDANSLGKSIQKKDDQLEDILEVVQDYSTSECIGDEHLLEEYERLLRERPWEKCECALCSKHGIEIAIFRGNNRNRRRGFHNTRRFYDQFEKELPKLVVLTRPGPEILNTETVEEYLREHRAEIWDALHDLPVIELGVVTASGIYEWWQDSPHAVSLDPTGIRDILIETCARYQDLFIDARSWDLDDSTRIPIEEIGCTVHSIDSPENIRLAVKDRLPLRMQTQLWSY